MHWPEVRESAVCREKLRVAQTRNQPQAPTATRLDECSTLLVVW